MLMYDASWSLRVQINKDMFMEHATYDMQSPGEGEGIAIWALLRQDGKTSTNCFKMTQEHKLQQK